MHVLAYVWHGISGEEHVHAMLVLVLLDWLCRRLADRQMEARAGGGRRTMATASGAGFTYTDIWIRERRSETLVPSRWT